MEKANTDTTYCTNKDCKEKCWRYKENWYFDRDTNYWFSEMENCEILGRKNK